MRDVGTVGRLYTYTVVYHPFIEQYRPYLPITTGLVSIPVTQSEEVRLGFVLPGQMADALVLGQAMEARFYSVGGHRVPMFMPSDQGL
jgi:hypothetical protein